MKGWDFDLQDGMNGAILITIACALFATNPPLAALGLLAGAYSLYTCISSADDPTIGV